MKKRGKKAIHKWLRIVISILTVILAGMLIYKGYALLQEKQEREELKVRNKEVQSEIDDIQMKIKELSGDSEALEAFLNDKVYQSDMENSKAVTANEIYGKEDTILIDIPEMAKPPQSDKEETASESISSNIIEQKPEEVVSGNAVIPNAEGTISGNAIVNGEVIPFRYEEMTLEQRRSIRSSFAETMIINGEDKAHLSQNTNDFSDLKIACLGDSITAGSNLSNMDNYEQYSYPSALKSILNAEEVYNLGIGGSSLSRFWDQAFVDRYREIPEDTDIIIVMGGTNDGFAASAKELGSLEEKKSRTFYGDVDELMRGLKKDYPAARIVFVTPPANILHDYLRQEREYLLPQYIFAEAIKELAYENGIDVIDLYNSNLLDTHDTQIISNYMPDGVHGNPAGYQILAEHLARSLVDIIERKPLYDGTVSGNSAESTISGNTVSGNGMDEETISGNGVMPEETVSENALRGKKEKKEKAESEAEKAAREKQAQENNKKVSEGAVVVPEIKPEEEKKKTEILTETDNTPTADTYIENDYEYGGEAIVIN